MRPRRSARLVALGAAGALGAGLLIPQWAGAQTAESVPLTFGTNTHGQLGDGSALTVARATPGAVTGLDDVVDIGGGREHVIALHADGTVVTWGSDQFGQIGNGAAVTSNQLSPVSVTGLDEVVDVDDGHYHSIALKADGTVWTWGFGSLGQLGNGGTSSNVPTPVQFGTLDQVAAVFGGRDMTYVMREDGTVWCSGGNSSGECGDDSYTAKIDWPVQVPGISGVVDMAGGRNHAIALKADGTVWTWGANDVGQLGDGTTQLRAEPEQVAGLSDVVDVAAGAEHSVAITSDGRVYTWGWGARAQLGLGDTNNRSTPTLVPGITDAAISEAGRDHTLIITTSGHLVTWGENSFLQAGDASGDDELTTPYSVPNLSNVVAAAGGQTYSVILQSVGSQPPPVLEDGFDSGLSGWTGGAAFALDETLSPTSGSPPSLRAVLANRRVSAWQALSASPSSSCSSIDVRMESASTSLALFRLRTVDGSVIATVTVRPNRSLRVRADLAGTNVKSTQKLPRQQWHRVGVCVADQAGSDDDLTITYDGAVVGASSSVQLAPVGQIQIGTNRKSTATFNLDNVEVSAS